MNIEPHASRLRRSHATTRWIARGERVGLRTPTWADEREFLELRRASRELHAPWEPEIPGVDPCSQAFFARYMRFGTRTHRWRFLICELEQQRIVGSISLSEVRPRSTLPAQLGYWIAAACARRGLMTEALRLLLKHVFDELRLAQLDAYVLSENVASKALLTKLGFRFADLAPAFRTLHGVARDHERWTITCPSRAGSGSPG